MATNEQKIVPHLWFDKEAVIAAEFYASVFPNSSVKSTATLHDTPSGTVNIVSYVINGYEFMAISAGPLFKINPSISFIVNFDPSRDNQAERNIGVLWDKLAQDGTVLMPFQEYPFSKRYGWVQDKFGVSWQLILSDPEGDERPYIVPSLLFTGDVCGKAEAAIDFYISVFANSKRGITARYPADVEPDREGTLMYADFMIEGQWFAAMDSALEHAFGFNEAVSLLVNCDTQEEIDDYWGKLSAVSEAEECGWLKDRFGVSWQIDPRIMENMLTKGNTEQIARVTQAFLTMKKFNIAALQRAYDGK